MNSIRFRLIVLFITATTTLLAAFGIYSRFQLSQSLESGFSKLTHATVTRLTVSLAGALWNLDQNSVQSILSAEMLQPQVSAIRVFDLDKTLYAAVSRDAQGLVVQGFADDQPRGVRLEADVYVNERKPNNTRSGDNGRFLAGHIEVYFSHDYIDQALRTDARRWVMEALVIDAILVLALSLSLRMVFVPLRRLRDALFELARHGGDEAQEIAEGDRSEFGEVIQGFNQTQRKLKHVMERRVQAEEAAHAAANKTAQAYSDLLATQESLIQAEKMASLGGLVAGVSHEINTPVGVVLTSASVLLEASNQLQRSMVAGNIRKSEVSSYVEMAVQSSALIMRNAERASQLIQSFKQVAVDQTSEQFRQYELNGYLEEVMTSLHPVLKKGRAEVSIVCPTGIFLEGYPGAMAQILTNLAMNSLTHAFKENEGGKINLVAELKGETVCMRYCDDGCGIAPEHIGKIFDPFFTTRRGLGGTGLGLNVVYNIVVKQLGGSIAVDSQPGKGTCFMLKFPKVSPTLV